MRFYINRLLRAIPSQCPFNRTVHLPGGIEFTIPPLCTLNPFYGSIMRAKMSAEMEAEGHD